MPGLVPGIHVFLAEKKRADRSISVEIALDSGQFSSMVVLGAYEQVYRRRRRTIRNPVCQRGVRGGCEAQPRVVKAPVAAPALSWTGFYLGGHVGYLWGKTRVEENGVLTEPGAPPMASAAGVLAGYQLQTGAYVFGVEAEFRLDQLRMATALSKQYHRDAQPNTISAGPAMSRPLRLSLRPLHAALPGRRLRSPISIWSPASISPSHRQLWRHLYRPARSAAASSASSPARCVSGSNTCTTISGSKTYVTSPADTYRGSPDRTDVARPP